MPWIIIMIKKKKKKKKKKDEEEEAEEDEEEVHMALYRYIKEGRPLLQGIYTLRLNNMNNRGREQCGCKGGRVWDWIRSEMRSQG